MLNYEVPMGAQGPSHMVGGVRRTTDFYSTNKNIGKEATLGKARLCLAWVPSSLERLRRHETKFQFATELNHKKCKPSEDCLTSKFDSTGSLIGSRHHAFPRKRLHVHSESSSHLHRKILRETHPRSKRNNV